MGDGLHLRAEDAEDLRVMSSFLQDALVPLADMHFEPAERRFVLALNRFRWEHVVAGQGGARKIGARPVGVRFERIACGVAFEAVHRVRLQNIERARRDRPLELLAVVARDEGEAGATIQLMFAGGGTIRLEAERIRVRLDDFGEPWPTRWAPRHRDPGEF
ncbi:MAG TPA: DUF2948 family protein [Alphaproteobacteria bacterium]|nr:DUF2948 family protein [Alphaproteobacteria bacterium]